MSDPATWTQDQVSTWLDSVDLGNYKTVFSENKINGAALLALTEDDLRKPPLEISVLGDLKRLRFGIDNLKLQKKQLNRKLLRYHEIHSYIPDCLENDKKVINMQSSKSFHLEETLEDEVCCISGFTLESECRRLFCFQFLNAEMMRTLLVYAIFNVVIFLECMFVVLATHRVPSRKEYPPLPDLFLDNVPYTPWCGDVSEYIILVTGIFCFIMGLLHKHRHVVFRRFFVIMAAVSMLRTTVMLMTSLSIPSVHTECEKVPLKSVGQLLYRTLRVWSGLGISLVGVRTCGDFMFSGHTIIITIVSFTLREYLPAKKCRFIHILTWVGNILCMVFILAAQKHYTIDVFIAFYVTSRLFLQYHITINNRNLREASKKYWRNWFPLQRLAEYKNEGPVPNEFESPTAFFKGILELVWSFKAPSITTDISWMNNNNSVKAASNGIKIV